MNQIYNRFLEAGIHMAPQGSVRELSSAHLQGGEFQVEEMVGKRYIPKGHAV